MKPSRLQDPLGLRRPTIPIAYPRLLLEVLADRGIERREACAGTGLREASLAEPEARVAPAQWGRLVLNAVRLSGDPGIGFELGLRVRSSAHGFLGYAAMTAPDLRRALQVTIRYFRMRNRQYRIHWRDDGATVALELHATRSAPALDHPLMFEFVLTGIAQSLGTLSGRRPPAVSLEFRWPQPGHFARYRRRLPPARFGCPANALRIPAAVLDWPLPLADEVAHRQALAQVEREYATVRGEDGDLVGRVRAELLPAADGYPDPAVLARRLLLSTRTLRRRLREAGAGYQLLLAEARERDARQLLAASDLDVQTIAARLGFQDPANFTRAFRRWSGLTPTAFRRGHT